MGTIGITTTRTDAGWAVTFDVLEGLAPVTAEAEELADALTAGRQAAFLAADRYLRGLGQPPTARVLLLLELRLRQAARLAQRRVEAEPIVYLTPPTWGTDVSTFPDLDPTFTLLDSRRIVAEAVARRLLTRHEQLADDPTYGFDVRALLHASGSPAEQASWRQQIAAQALADERVSDADVELVRQGGGWRIGVRLATADGPFRLVLSINQVTAALLVEP